MATRMLRASAWATLLLRVVSALQVTPGSPCSSFCIDAPELDETDPESSNTEPEDITCRDEDYTDQEAGQKFQRCLTCLQDSEFSYGHESDQQWFFCKCRLLYCEVPSLILMQTTFGTLSIIVSSASPTLQMSRSAVLAQRPNLAARWRRLSKMA